MTTAHTKADIYRFMGNFVIDRKSYWVEICSEILCSVWEWMLNKIKVVYAHVKSRVVIIYEVYLMLNLKR